MLDLLVDFPGQVGRSFVLAKGIKCPGAFRSISSIIFSGLGGSAIGGDLAGRCVANEIKVPFLINRDYDIPNFINKNTLFFVSSYSGNTEETISAYKKARAKKAKIIVLTGGGKLSVLAKKDGYPVIDIPEKDMPPRCALAYSFIPALFCLSKIGLIRDKSADIIETINTLSYIRDTAIGPGVCLADNVSKKIAVDLKGRFVAVYGWSKGMGCAVTRWRGQICENAKAIATSHFLPEMNHNEIMGFSHPQALLKDIVVVLLRDKGDNARVKSRIDISRRILKKKVCKVIEVHSSGEGLLARICSLIYTGDFASFYLALLNGEDPTPVDEITYLKKELAKRK